MSNIKKNKNVQVTTKTGGKYSYNYTDLASINDYLEANNIKYYQYIESTEYGDYIMTVVIENGVEKPPRRGCKVISASTTSGGNVAQDYGAILTYCRRYSLLLALGLATDDNDANELTKGTYEVKEKVTSITTKEDAEKYVITFGKKHNGETLKEIAEKDPNYITWLINGEKTDEVIKQAITLLTGEVEDKTPIAETKINEGQKQIIEDLIKKGKADLQGLLNYYKVAELSELNFGQAQEVINKKIKE